MQFNPYEILGVSERDSLAHIENTYKNLIKLLHPDKAHTTEARKLKMSAEDKMQYIQIIRKAYTTIMDVRKETQYPDYTMDYSVDQDTRINLYQGLTQDDAKNFNTQKFNNIFEMGLERDRKAGIQDPFGRGYDVFDKGKQYDGAHKVTLQTYNHDVPVETPKEFYKPDMQDNRLVEYLPDALDLPTIGKFQELGLATVTDFSVTLAGKGAIAGADLDQVYGKNYEYWETSVQRDPHLRAKYSDTTSLGSRMANTEKDRGNIYNLPPDNKMLEAEKARNFAMEQKEKIRHMTQAQQDEYFDFINAGRITLPPR